MNFWPFWSIGVFFSLLVGVFLWSPLLFLLGLVVGVCVVLSVVYFVVFGFRSRFRFAFFLFLLSEAMVFLALLVSVLWFEEGYVSSLSFWGGIPLTGCVLLVSSSFAASLFHCSSFFRESGMDSFRFWLGYAIFFGSVFVSLQLVEFWGCWCDLLTNAYYASSFCVVGLHFLHVVIGLFFLGFVFCLDYFLSFYYVELFVWYWHFVDYVWLFVFLVVYIL